MHPLDQIIKESRIKSRYDLFLKTSIAQSTLSDMTKREVEAITIKNLKKIAKALDMSPGKLLDRLLELEQK